MKREILCFSCENNSRKRFKCDSVDFAVPFANEYVKYVPGKAKRCFTCDHCGLLLRTGDVCCAVSIRTTRGGIPYYEWEHEYLELSNKSVVAGVKVDTGRIDRRSKHETPKAQEGIWTLVAPDGRKWQAESPIKVVAAEQRERVPEHVAVERILVAAFGYCQCEHPDRDIAPFGDHCLACNGTIKS